MANGIIADQIQKKLGKFAAGISQKMALISKYEKAVTSRTTEDLSAERMAKLSSKISSRAIADVMNQSTKYELPTGYMKQVRMIHLAFERSTAKLMRDAKEIEYVLKQRRSSRQKKNSRKTGRWRFEKQAVGGWNACLRFERVWSGQPEGHACAERRRARGIACRRGLVRAII